MDYSNLALPKTGETPKKRRARRRRKMLAVAADDREQVFARQGQVCYVMLRVFYGAIPWCRTRATDPHELIPVSLGGPRESWNRVGLCRACHRMAQGRVGGNRIVFDWPGRADGVMPNANRPGNVRVLFGRSA